MITEKPIIMNMSKDVKQKLRQAESTIEEVLHALHEEGIHLYRIQLILNRNAAPSVTLILDERGGL